MGRPPDVGAGLDEDCVGCDTWVDWLGSPALVGAGVLGTVVSAAGEHAAADSRINSASSEKRDGSRAFTASLLVEPAASVESERHPTQPGWAARRKAAPPEQKPAGAAPGWPAAYGFDGAFLPPPPV